MRLSQSGLDFIKQWEGFRGTPYRDAGGYLTIGYGHKINPGERFTSLSREEAEQILANDVRWAEDAVNRLVTVPLTQSMYDALVSLVFNWGAGSDAFGGSILLQRLNAGDYDGAAQRLSEHPITSKGVVVPGLINRRREEAAMFRREGMPGSGAPSPGLDPGPDPYPEPTSDPDTPAPTSTTNWLLIGGILAVLVVVLMDD